MKPQEKNKKHFWHGCILLILLCSLSFLFPAASYGEQTTETSTAADKKGLVKEGTKYYYYSSNGKKVTNKWKTVNGYRYYFQSDGSAAVYSTKINGTIYVFDKKGRLYRPSKARFITSGKYTYYVDKKGRAATGWMVINNKLYRADGKGRLCRNKTYQGITFTSNFYAKNNTNAKLKIKTMQILSGITTSEMSKPQKLRACWNYVVSGNIRYVSYYPNLNTNGWQRTTALRTLTLGTGNCYGYACAFAALANEVGYTPYVVCGRVSGTTDGASDGLTRHCWVKIGSAYYDPEAQYAGWYRGVYGIRSYDIYHVVSSTVKF